MHGGGSAGETRRAKLLRQIASPIICVCLFQHSVCARGWRRRHAGSIPGPPDEELLSKDPAFHETTLCLTYSTACAKLEACQSMLRTQEVPNSIKEVK